MHDVEALMVKVEGLKDDAVQKEVFQEVLQEVLQKEEADKELEVHLLGLGRQGEDKPSVVSLLVKQRDVTSL